MRSVFPSSRAILAGAAAGAILASGCDQNMSDTPLPATSAADLARLATRLSEAPSLSVPAGANVSGTIELDPRLAALTAPSDVVFVIARDPSNDGPPLAVLRLGGNAYPMRFVLDASSAMLPGGAELSGPVQLIVKVDKDGDANTSGVDDLLGFTEDPIEPGDGGVRVTIEGTLGEFVRAVGTDAGRDSTSTTPAAPATAPAAGPAIAGVLELPPALAPRTSPSDVVFVIARRPGAAGGPPVAVARLRGNRYPMPFELTPSDLMLGGSWPPEVELEARVDGDGDATTREPDALQGRATGGIRPGARDVRIRLGG